MGVIPDYTGFKDAKELGSHFHAGKIAADGNTVALKVGNLNILEFDQTRHPDAYAITFQHTVSSMLLWPNLRLLLMDKLLMLC